MKGVVVAVNISKEKGVRKTNVKRARAIPEFGLEGDAHGGNWHRQVSLLARESIEKMKALGLKLKPGDFAENITTNGLDLLSLEIGTKLRIGKALLQVTQRGKECHLGCEIRRIVGDCIMPREGIFARVLEEGEIKIGDEIEVLNEGSGLDNQ
ncbi:MAG: MOSC domain-containing protein [Caldiserica bacterium]|jgi:MOSC domain-containing protein YiiM|nr:MOSC domain-containing protein [Caldisericota bacterium]MDH7563109.1 MOSC domain-containing protein [Caldisericota bacterium]